MQIVTSTTPSGILTRTANVPGRTYGAVVFGVGTRDEPVATAGMAHLALHLIEAALEPRLIPSRARLDANSITFEASGTTAQVVAHFRAIADAVLALGSVTAYELGRAKRLLEVEEPGEYRHPGVDVFTFRYGLGELGRTGFGFPGIAATSKKDIARWAASRLVAENTAVVLTKPLTASFDLDLPTGPVPTRGDAVQILETPTLVASENLDVCASLVVPAAGAEALADAIKFGLRERLVDQAGLAYDVSVATARVDEATAALSFDVSPRRDDLPETVRALVLGLQDIADDGVSPAAVTLAVEFARLELASDPASVRDSLVGEATLSLRGFSADSRDETLGLALALTPETVAAAVAAAMPSLLVAFDDDADEKTMAKVAKGLSLPIDPFRLLQPVSEKLWKKAVKGDAVVFTKKKIKGLPDAEAVITDSALLHRYEDDSYAAVEFDDLILVGERPNGTLVLVDGAGRWLPFTVKRWKNGQRFVKALRKAVPAELVREFPAV
ncbi:hypothetical protein [Frondihabitans australicus]|uniref:Putative Zn-dependent peptidase n=1 Tax=Frondihabitans australicus TaxID=386892 RepID=A0A495IJS0_9MICO|nr:hypothetical protein [Frondihabitans australicus]RKR76217.1 putative Zn-dependent peptidase [Frondihabitans australicus]